MQQPLPPSPSGGGQHWEGEGTLHSYCYDYMRKRGWTETASAFAADAGINEDEWKGPPIEAPQGLLYEWWSVFWDVFIARSQSTGKRNVMADTYVESMRSKRDPLVVQFAGLPPAHSISLPRSLAHPPRVPVGHPPNSFPGPAPRPSYTNPGQLHVLQQQQLQEQLQQGRTGPPMVGQHQRTGPPLPGQYHPQASTSQGSPYIQPGHPSQQPQQSPYAAPHPGQAYQQQQQHPSRPPSAQSSPHLGSTPHLYANGRPPPPQGMMGGPRPSDPMGAAFAQSLAAVGLAGREPESLNPEEQAAVTAQMRRIGALPPLSAQGQQQQVLYRPQQARAPPQRLNPDQQRMQAQQQQYAQQQNQQGSPQIAQQHLQQQQQHMIQQQQQQQQQMLQQHHVQQQRIQHANRQDVAYLPPGMQHSSSQVGSPSSPACSSAPSPYATPLQSHLPHPAQPGTQGTQASPPGSAFNAPLPPPSRVVKGRVPPAASARMSPANSKRSVEDPSPRTRKRQRGSTKDEDRSMNGDETPRFDQSGPPSPANGGNPYALPGAPYRPSQSPVQHDAALMMGGNPTRLSAQQLQGADIARQAGEVRQHTLDQMNGGPSGSHDELGVLGHSDPMMKLNGSGPSSRPGSSASYGRPNGKHSPALSPHPQAHGVLDSPLNLAQQHSGLGQHPQYPSQHGPPALHISIPPMPPPSVASFQLPNGNDLTPGGRPFAGAHGSTLGGGLNTMGPPNGEMGSHQPDGSMPPPSQPGFEYPSSGADPFADLSGLDFQFDAFLEMGAFKEDETGDTSNGTLGTVG